MDTTRAFFSKIRAFFFDFQKGLGRPPLFPPGSAPVSVAKYAPILLNISKYLWKIIERTVLTMPGSEYAWSSYMFDRLLKMLRVIDKLGSWIWHGCKGYTEFRRCLHMASYASIMPLNMPQYPLICLNMAEYCWISLNIPENAWINCSDYARFLNIPYHHCK